MDLNHHLLIPHNQIIVNMDLLRNVRSVLKVVFHHVFCVTRDCMKTV